MTFRFQGRDYYYFDHPYNDTRQNERRVEIPIACAMLDPSMLEIGNVLGHYGVFGHRVVDKYERGSGVENLDVVDLVDEKRYPLVLSISTLEHVGFDEAPDQTKLPRAIDVLRALLTPGGRIVATIPLGYNSSADAWMMTHADEAGFLLRVNRENEWCEVKEPPPSCRYGYPFPFGNVLGVFTIKKREER